MSTIKQILDYFEEFAPLSLAESWDNCGLLIGDENKEIKRAMLCLDITNDVINEARAENADLLISHHPVIFRPLSSLKSTDSSYNLIKSEIAAVCMHTNLDRAEEGVNFALAKALNLKDLEYYPDDFIITGTPDKKYTSKSFAKHVKDCLKTGMIRYTGDRDIKKVAVSSGGGGEGIFRSSVYGFDAFVSGEIKHNQFIYANENDISAYEAGHYSTEIVILKPLFEKLKNRFSDISFIISDNDKDPVNYL